MDTLWTPEIHHPRRQTPHPIPPIYISLFWAERWCDFCDCLFLFRDLLGEECAMGTLKIKIERFAGHTPPFSASLGNDY